MSAFSALCRGCHWTWRTTKAAADRKRKPVSSAADALYSSSPVPLESAIYVVGVPEVWEALLQASSPQGAYTAWRLQRATQ